MKYFFCIVLSFTFLCSVFAQTTQELKDRLNFIDGELGKINERIKNGQDPQLFKKYIDEFEAERTKINGQLAKPQAKAEQKAELKKVVNVKWEPSVEIQAKDDRDQRYKEVTSLLEGERAKKLDFLERGISGNKLRQVEINISYLELEQSVLSKELSKSSVRKGLAALKYHGHMQFRTEYASNQTGIQEKRQAEESYFRLRTYFTFSPNDRVDFNFTPQAAKGFGKNTSSGAVTSGGTTHTELHFYEANIDYNIWKPFFVKLGRQELSYGDHLIIGALPWANDARSFDGLKLKYKYQWGWTDLFYSKITDNGNSLSNDDTNLFSFYNSWNFDSIFKDVDLYYISKNNKIPGQIEVNTVGMRAKGGYGPVFFRTENSTQKGANLGDDAYQYNIEAGGTINSYGASVEYALAGPNYQQLYPTAHKFLGFADVLGRRNIKQIALHLKGDIASWLDIKADYHIFKRNKTNKSAYKLNGTSTWGTTGSSDDIGKEFDLVFTFKAKEDSLNFQLGGAFFSPGQYMKDQDTSQRDETVRFVYGQLLATF